MGKTLYERPEQKLNITRDQRKTRRGPSVRQESPLRLCLCCRLRLFLRYVVLVCVRDLSTSSVHVLICFACWLLCVLLLVTACVL